MQAKPRGNMQIIGLTPPRPRLLSEAGNTRKDASKSAKWEVRIARELRSRSTATNAWIAQRLAVGHPPEYAV